MVILYALMAVLKSIQKKITAVQAIFNYYLNGASLWKVVDMLISKNIPSPTGKQKWTRASVDKLLSNAKYIPVVGESTYLDVQYEKAARCNVDYDRAGHPRKENRYVSPQTMSMGR